MVTCTRCWFLARAERARQKVQEWAEIPSLASPWKKVLADMEALAEHHQCQCQK